MGFRLVGTGTTADMLDVLSLAAEIERISGKIPYRVDIDRSDKFIDKPYYIRENTFENGHFFKTREEVLAFFSAKQPESALLDPTGAKDEQSPPLTPKTPVEPDWRGIINEILTRRNNGK